MRRIFSLLIIVFTFKTTIGMGAEAGMPQLNPQYWISQIFWLIFIFVILYLIIWKSFLPKIGDSIKNRKEHIISNLDETQRLKEEAEKKLEEYEKIISDSKNQAKKIIIENKIKLEKNIEEKRKEFDKEIENELKNVEKSIKDFQKSSISDINKIAVVVSTNIIENTLKHRVNASNVSAIVEDVAKTELKKYL